MAEEVTETSATDEAVELSPQEQSAIADEQRRLEDFTKRAQSEYLSNRVGELARELARLKSE